MEKNCPTNWNGHSHVWYADCKGYFKCVEPKCPFKVQYVVVNTKQFDHLKDGEAEFVGRMLSIFHVPLQDT